jgi:RHS repeat-associated protein
MNRSWHVNRRRLCRNARGAKRLLTRRARHSAFSIQHWFYASDAGGNVMALLDTGNRLAARYHYDPFGNLIGLAGPMADANLYRFSSKEFHANSSLYYYGFRFYDPNLQRWLNRLGTRSPLNLVKTPESLTDDL